MQHATPTTFGLKAAGWLEALLRAQDRIHAAVEAALVLQLGGASGTLAALGAEGPAVARALGARLGLRVPDLPWHAHRDRLAHLAAALGVAVGSLGKIAKDLALLAQTEVGEAAVAGPGGGSSSMPHKRNPVAAAVVLAAATRAPGLVATLLAALPQEHERGLGGWQAEWEVWPELVGLAERAAVATAEALEALIVDAERMRANIDLARGGALAEAVTMALARHVGRSEAYQAVQAALREAERTDGPLAGALSAHPVVGRYLPPGEIADLLAPERYLVAAEEMVSRALARFRARGG
jgi:3-carboxy-cis,cis-muconate cycloisomerase